MTPHRLRGKGCELWNLPIVYIRHLLLRWVQTFLGKGDFLRGIFHWESIPCRRKFPRGKSTLGEFERSLTWNPFYLSYSLIGDWILHVEMFEGNYRQRDRSFLFFFFREGGIFCGINSSRGIFSWEKLSSWEGGGYREINSTKGEILVRI